MGVATVAREHRRPSTSTTTTAPPQTATAPPLRHAPQQSARRSTTTTAPLPSLTPRNLHIRPSLCGTFTVVAEDYSVPLLKDANGGALPMDRRCTVKVYERAQSAKAAVLLVHGFASNRTMFDAGGGKGRDGPSFFEFLAQRNYDAFAIDLRGTRESLRRGARAPAYVKEHIEIDVPSAIAAIKRIGHEKVYLIGHSMGGAISCAVAGHIPHDVAGVVHLAGLLSPEPSSDAPPVGILHPAAQSSLPTLGAAASVRYAATYIRRQIIPVRSIVDSMLFMRHFLPTTVSKALLNMLYPSPWLPYSVDDPASFVDLALESPTVGICVSMAKSAVHRDVFNAWLEDSSHHRAENPQIAKQIQTVMATSNLYVPNTLHRSLARFRLLSSLRLQK
ncbi:alpha/beta-hydrolase [Rhizoclosmatium globosum]|uniref:Alpha/beta-hydrolase n=1 Tax=Rhizoclosmatium globosum TaxID=329046 RepID=A0A1Y2CMM2_9FUNG|nr:alpha/beta-hydrolase [Rhizoclosmatium globosum]|eukprot:ORY48176.1 alpha/beta-hydrolase [Rhizoclosmatium globosum]